MGLEEFMDLGEDDNSSSSGSNRSKKTRSSPSKSKLTNFDNWTKDSKGKLQRNGPFGYESYDEYEETFDGEMKTHGDLFKYFLPIFPHIENEDKFKAKRRYKTSPSQDRVTCISHVETKLGNITREVIMLDCGSTEKDECLSTLEERFDTEVGPETTVHLYMFCFGRHLTKMAMADEFADIWSLENKDRVLKAVYNESYTQEFRKKDTGERDLKSIVDIGVW